MSATEKELAEARRELEESRRIWKEKLEARDAFIDRLAGELKRVAGASDEITGEVRKALATLQPVLERLNDLCTCEHCGAVYASREQLGAYHLVYAPTFGRKVCPKELEA